MIERRTLIRVAATGLLIASLGAYAQQPATPVIGFFHEGSRTESAHAAAAFREGLSETGYVEGRNVTIEYRWAEGQYDRLPALVNDLVRRQVAVIAGGGGPRSARAAKAATATIPIVFTVGVDPVKFDLVASLSRPEGNVTGVTMFTDVLTTKRLGLLREVLPTLTGVAFLVNPSNPNAEAQVREMQEASSALGLRLHVLGASADSGIDAAFAAMTQQRIGALLVSADPFLSSRKDRLVALTARYAVPAIYQWRNFVEVGGLMSYGSSNTDAYRQTGVYAGRILKGAKPADLPVLQPSRFELVINLKTAKALRLTIPQSMLLRVDEVIE